MGFAIHIFLVEPHVFVTIETNKIVKHQTVLHKLQEIFQFKFVGLEQYANCSRIQSFPNMCICRAYSNCVYLKYYISQQCIFEWTFKICQLLSNGESKISNSFDQGAFTEQEDYDMPYNQINFYIYKEGMTLVLQVTLTWFK